MRALTFKAIGEPLAVGTVADPHPGEGGMVIRVARCGVCGTDLHATSGHGIPLSRDDVIGHEFSGEVVALGKGVEVFALGDPIAAMPTVGCGHCEQCATGIDILCTNHVPYSQGLVEYALVIARGATMLPRTISLADGALVEPMAVGARGVRLADPASDSKVLPATFEAFRKGGGCGGKLQIDPWA